MKGERLMVFPGTADDIRAAITALRSLDVSKGVSFHTFSFPEDRCMRLRIKNLGRGMPETVMREERDALGIFVQEVQQLRSGRRDQDPEKDRPATPHFIVTMARGPDVSKVRAITQLCGLRTTVESYTTPGVLCSADAGSALDTPSVAAVTHPGASRVARPTCQAGAQHPKNSLNVVAAEETTPRTTGAAESGRKRRRRL
jgi:hypothetical protein